jgi:hypothetical protein
MGQKQTWQPDLAMSALPPESGHVQCASTTLADFIQAAFLRQSVFGSGDIAEAAVEARD